MRLALAMGKTHEQLKCEMSAEERDRWRVLEEIDPFGQKRMDYHFAHLASVIVNALGASKPDKTRFTVTDFLPPFPIVEKLPDIEKPKQQTPEQIERILSTWVFASNLAFRKH